MKTSDPQEQFLTSMKNGKVSIFRSKTTAADIIAAINGVEETEQTDYNSVYIGNMLEVFFTDDNFNALNAVTFRFWHSEDKTHVSPYPPKPWQKRLNIGWLEWILKVDFEEMKLLLENNKIRFWAINFADGDFGIATEYGHADINFVFTSDGKLEVMRLDFKRFQFPLTFIKEMKGFNL